MTAVLPEPSVELFGGPHHGDVLSAPPGQEWLILPVKNASPATNAFYWRAGSNVAVFAGLRPAGRKKGPVA